jgi:ankyrin repeat protein
MRDGTGGSEGGDADIINELLEHGARGDSPDIFGLSPLQYVLLNRDKVALVLLSPRASTAPYTAFLVAVASDQASKVASQLKAHPAWATYRLPSGATALHVAATWGAPSSITTLLKAGAEVNGRDAFGQTPLALASRVKGNSAAERILLSHRADVSVRDWRDSTPLHAAVAAEDLDAVRLLIAAKADVNAHSASIEPPLTTAMRDTGKEIAVALLEAGADPNAAGPDQSTPLMGAIRANNADLVRLLIAKKANVNATTSREGRSPLWTAVEQRNTQIVRLLLDAGANTGSAPNFGMSISQMAKNMGSPEIAAMIDAKQAQTTGGGSTKQ